MNTPTNAERGIEEDLKATDEGRERLEEADSRITRWVADRHHQGEDAVEVEQGGTGRTQAETLCSTSLTTSQSHGGKTFGSA